MDIKIERADKSFPLILGHLKVVSNNNIMAYTMMYPSIDGYSFLCEEYDVNEMEIKHSNDGVIHHTIGYQGVCDYNSKLFAKGVTNVDGTFNFVNDSDSVDKDGVRKIVPFTKKNISIPFSYTIRSNTSGLRVPNGSYNIGSVSDMRIIVDRYYQSDLKNITAYSVKLGWTNITSGLDNTTSVWADANTELILKVNRKEIDERTYGIDVYFIMKPVLMKYEDHVYYTVVNCALCADNAVMCYPEEDRNYKASDIMNDNVFRDIITSDRRVLETIGNYDAYTSSHMDILNSLVSKQWYFMNGPCTMLIDKEQKSYSKVVFDMDKDRRE